MDSDIATLSWLSLTKRVLFSPRAFFAQSQAPFSYRSSLLYLLQTASVVSLINSLVITLVFFVVVACFATFLATFIVIFGTLLTPLIAVAANIPPDKVPGAVDAIAKNAELQVGVMSAKLGAFLLVGYFGTIVASTCLQAGIAHGIARLLGCADTFRATAFVYSVGSAAWILSVVPIVNVFAPIYGAVLDVFGMRHVHRLSSVKAMLTVAMAVAVPVIAFIVCSSRSN